MPIGLGVWYKSGLSRYLSSHWSCDRLIIHDSIFNKACVVRSWFSSVQMCLPFQEGAHFYVGHISILIYMHIIYMPYPPPPAIFLQSHLPALPSTTSHLPSITFIQPINHHCLSSYHIYATYQPEPPIYLSYLYNLSTTTTYLPIIFTYPTLHQCLSSSYHIYLIYKQLWPIFLSYLYNLSTTAACLPITFMQPINQNHLSTYHIYTTYQPPPPIYLSYLPTLPCTNAYFPPITFTWSTNNCDLSSHHIYATYPAPQAIFLLSHLYELPSITVHFPPISPWIIKHTWLKHKVPKA